MPEYLVYGKIHIDHIRQVSAERVFLGGGGPQGVFGALVWSPSVGLLSRVGTDLEPVFEQQLADLGVDLQGVVRFAHLPTPHTLLAYDENEYMIQAGFIDPDAWVTMQKTPIPLPDAYRSARVMHLITEWADAPMVEQAKAHRAAGGLFSLEPLIDYERWSNREAIVALLPSVDVVTPDWPSASGIAGSDRPAEVLRCWAGFGAGVVAIRHGAQGAYVWSRDEDRLWHLPPVPIERVVDPTGAGNAFGGGLAVGWDTTRDARTAAAYGAIAAYLLLGMPGIPPIDEATRARARALVEPTVAAARELP